MKRGTAALIFLIFSTGCGTILKVTNLNSPPMPLSQKNPGDVEVFTTGKPNVPYTEISLISSQQASEFSSDDTPEIIQKMREEAAKQGCDALVITMPNDQTSGSTGKYGSIQTMKGFHGTCVVYNN